MTLLIEALRMIADGRDAWAARVAKRALNREALKDCGHQGTVVEDTPGEGAGGRRIIVSCHQTTGHAGKHDGEQP